MGDRYGVVFDDTPDRVLGVWKDYVRRVGGHPDSLLPNWMPVVDLEGDTYYWNTKTEKTQWERPAADSPAADGSGEPKVPGVENNDGVPLPEDETHQDQDAQNTQPTSLQS